jgi:hypothetical protein
MQEVTGMVMLVSDVEVQLMSALGETVRVGFTNHFGMATFVVEEGFYNIVSIHDGEEQSRWVFIGCGETIEGIKFVF